MNFEAAPSPSDTNDEASLVRRIVAGDRVAFEVLMRRHNRRLYRLARASLRDEKRGAGCPDMKRHDLGPNFHERNYNGTITTHFMTEPLWGVGSSPPYGHDGRSINLREVILRHGGEALASRNAFAALPDTSKSAIFEFLNTLVLFPPDDTASNLDPGNRSTPTFPQRGHGSIRLPTIFNNPAELE